MAFGEGTMLGSYRLECLIGQGGMSDVYRAHDEQTGAAVAVKVVRSADPQLARRLALEVRALESFQHPGLVRLLDSGVYELQPYMVMELVEGPTLAQVVQRGPLMPAQVRHLALRLADALAYVHAQGIVHRDVKPGNVLLDARGDAKLADFGIARLVDSSTLTVTGTTLGTAAYMAPEQIEDHDVGPPADIWSLGAVLAECLTGRRLYVGTPSEVVARRMHGPLTLPPGLPPAWSDLLTQMLSHDVAVRPTGAEVVRRLSGPELVALDGAAVNPDATQPSWPQGTRVSPAAAVLAGGSLAPTWVEAGDTRNQSTPGAPITAPVPVSPRGPHRPARKRFAVMLAIGALVAGAGGATATWAFNNNGGPKSGNDGPSALGRITGAGTAKGTSLPPRSTTTRVSPTTATTGASVTTDPPTNGRASTATTTPPANSSNGAGLPAHDTGAVANALMKLDGDLAAGVLAGSLDSEVARSVQSFAQRATLAASYGDTFTASADIASANGVVQSAVANGSADAGTARQLVQDLGALGASLGPAGPGGAPAQGHGHGNGVGGGPSGHSPTQPGHGGGDGGNGEGGDGG